MSREIRAADLQELINAQCRTCTGLMDRDVLNAFLAPYRDLMEPGEWWAAHCYLVYSPRHDRRIGELYRVLKEET